MLSACHSDRLRALSEEIWRLILLHAAQPSPIPLRSRFAASCHLAKDLVVDKALWRRITLALHPDLRESLSDDDADPSYACCRAFAAGGCTAFNCTPIANVSAAPRQLHAMCILSDQLCMFGGWHIALGPCNELQCAPVSQLTSAVSIWPHPGIQFSEVPAPADTTWPGRRYGHTMTKLNAHSAVLLGGHDMPGFWHECPDVWTLTIACDTAVTATWTRCSDWDPLPGYEESGARAYHSASLVHLGGQTAEPVVLVFGGVIRREAVGAPVLWDCGSKSWAELDAVGSCPSARCGHTANVVGRQLVLMGGTPEAQPRSDEVLFDPLWCLDLDNQTWVRIARTQQTSSTLTRCRHLSFHSTVSFADRLVTFGGGANGSNDILVLDVSSTAQHSDPDWISSWKPRGRFGHCAFALGLNLYVLGGVSGGQEMMSAARIQLVPPGLLGTEHDHNELLDDDEYPEEDDMHMFYVDVEDSEVDSNSSSSDDESS